MTLPTPPDPTGYPFPPKPQPTPCVTSPTGQHEHDPETAKCKHCGKFWHDLFNGLGEAIGEAKFGE